MISNRLFAVVVTNEGILQHLRHPDLNGYGMNPTDLMDLTTQSQPADDGKRKLRGGSALVDWLESHEARVKQARDNSSREEVGSGEGDGKEGEAGLDLTDVLNVWVDDSDKGDRKNLPNCIKNRPFPPALYFSSVWYDLRCTVSNSRHFLGHVDMDSSADILFLNFLGMESVLPVKLTTQPEPPKEAADVFEALIGSYHSNLSYCVFLGF
jgi:hypothetical protein